MKLPWQRRHPVEKFLDEQFKWMVNAIELIKETDPDAADCLVRNISDRMRLRERDVHPLDTPRDVTEIVIAALEKARLAEERAA